MARVQISVRYELNVRWPEDSIRWCLGQLGLGKRGRVKDRYGRIHPAVVEMPCDAVR